MSFFTEDELLNSGRSYRMQKSASTIILEDSNIPITTNFDIFLSHSYLDRDRIFGIKSELEKFNYSVYVDWEVDNDLNRNNVTRESADRIRERMKRCECLLYAISNNASQSKWMPWECGYFDGLKHKVAIIPVTKLGYENFNRQEYLSLYPYLDKEKTNNGLLQLWINEHSDIYVNFNNWLTKGERPYKHQS